MGIFNKLFGGDGSQEKEQTQETTAATETVETYSYADFWNWFAANSQQFFEVVKSKEKIEEGFFEKLTPALDKVKEGYYFVTGMMNDDTAELILTADGSIEQIVYVEEIVAAAPQIPNWHFTALKQPGDIQKMGIQFGDLKFDKDSLHFYAVDHADYPDEIDIRVTHPELTEENKDAVFRGVALLIDNYIGELQYASIIDHLDVINTKDAEAELVPFEKLEAFLNWRQKEFIEKYEGVRKSTDEDNYSIMKAELNNGMPLFATINTALLEWEPKASHPWVAILMLKYDGAETEGMPDAETSEAMYAIEDELQELLAAHEGNLYVGRQTAESTRDIFYACKDFRVISKAMHQIAETYSEIYEPNIEIFKDKYWQTFERFRP